MNPTSSDSLGYLSNEISHFIGLSLVTTILRELREALGVKEVDLLVAEERIFLNKLNILNLESCESGSLNKVMTELKGLEEDRISSNTSSLITQIFPPT